MRRLEKYGDHAYGLLRVVSGFLFTFHGVQKVFGVLRDSTPAVGSQLWIGGLIELATGIAIMIGLGTRYAAFLASGTMAVAYIQFHWKFRFGSAFFPAVNQGELAAIYCFLFLYIACRGAGKWGMERKGEST